MPNADWAGFQETVTVWGPRILAAIVILLVAWVVGKAVKWGVGRGVDKLPGARHHNAGLPPKETVGARLGDVAYWLVLLIGVVAALNALQLGAVVAPLNSMLYDILGYVPNIIGAVLIFFIGFLVAGLARRVVSTGLQAMNLDRLLNRTGVSQVTSGGALSSALGTLVFVLILIPVAIAALQTLQIDAISRPAIAVLNTILGAIPNVLAAAIVLAIGWLIGRWIGGVIERVLPATGFDRAIGALGSTTSFVRPAPPPTELPEQEGAAPPSGTTPSKIVANIVFFAIVAFSAIEAARMLQFAAISDILQQVLGLAGHIVVGGVIITAGVLIADLLANMIDRSTQGAERFASTIVRWATIALATAMGLRFMGIADEIVILAFGLILGSAAVAAALAFGLGGRDAAGRLAARWLDKAQQPQGQAPARGRQARGAAAEEPRTIPPGSPGPRVQ
jgi:hypothetical protein